MTDTSGLYLQPEDEEDLSECVRTWQELIRGSDSGGPNFSDLVKLSLTAPCSPSAASQSRCSITHGDRDHWQKLSIDTAIEIAERCGPVFLLNVGGQVFEATAGTLRKAPFFDALLMDPATNAKAIVDTDGHFFVDRPADLFARVLEFLRGGQWLLGDRALDINYVSAVREEALFYGLDAAAELLTAVQITEYVTVWQFQDDTSLYVDCSEHTMREDPDHQGSFRLCKYSGGLPLDQQTCTKRFKAKSQSMHSVIAYFAMRGFTLQHIVQGSLVTHVTSADGLSRNGPTVQYLLSRSSTAQPARTPPNSQR